MTQINLLPLLTVITGIKNHNAVKRLQQQQQAKADKNDPVTKFIARGYQPSKAVVKSVKPAVNPVKTIKSGYAGKLEKLGYIVDNYDIRRWGGVIIRGKPLDNGNVSIYIRDYESKRLLKQFEYINHRQFYQWCYARLQFFERGDFKV